MARNFLFPKMKWRSTTVVTLWILSAWSVNSCSALVVETGQGGNTQAEEGRGSDIYGGFLNRMGLTPAETLWIGSHKINWSPLPLFLQFTSPNRQQQQQPVAEGRSFNPLSPFQVQNYPYNQQQFAFTNAAKVTPSTGSSSPPPSSQYPLQSRSTTEHTRATQSHSTTPLPISSSIFADALIDLSTPGPSVTPIVDRLRKMTEWSRQKTLLKKEGRFDQYDMRKKLKRKYYQSDRDNIQAIIDAPSEPQHLSHPKKVQKIKRKSKEQRANSSPKVIVHPTNSAYLIEDPLLQLQASAMRRWEINRQEKNMKMFQSRDGLAGQAPVSFRFGPQDAKMSPYRH